MPRHLRLRMAIDVAVAVSAMAVTAGVMGTYIVYHAVVDVLTSGDD
jgi:hypothetical protein